MDAGRQGAVALLDTDAGTVEIEDVRLECDRTLDCAWLWTLLTDRAVGCGVIEEVFRPNSLCELKGEYQAVFKLAQVPLTHVAVVTWKKKILGANTSDKERSIACAQTLYPNADINRLSPKRRKATPNHDRAEALLLAHWLATTSTA